MVRMIVRSNIVLVVYCVFSTFLMSLYCNKAFSEALSSNSNTDLLILYGEILKKTPVDHAALEPVEAEIQKRNLLNVREVASVLHPTFWVDMRSAVVLAALGEPYVVMVNPRYPGLQVWIYLLFLPGLNPIKVEATGNNRVMWAPYLKIVNQSRFDGAIFFIKSGKIVGLKIVTNHKERNDGFENLYQATSGYTFDVLIKPPPPFREFLCQPRCDGLSIQ